MDARNSASLLREGEIYVVLAVHVVPGIPRQYVFVDGAAGLHPGWWAHRFRRATDISNLTALLVEPSGTKIQHNKVLATQE